MKCHSDPFSFCTWDARAARKGEMELERDAYEQLKTVVINGVVYHIVDSYVKQPQLALNMVELMTSYAHKRMFNLVFPKDVGNECFEIIFRLVEKAIHENGSGKLGVRTGTCTCGAGDYDVDGNWGRYVQIQIELVSSLEEANTSTQTYQNNVEAIGKNVARLSEAILAILNILGEVIEDKNHPVYMFVNQLSKSLMKISKKTSSLETLVNTVLVMEQCESGAWSNMSQKQRSEWMMNRAAEMTLKAKLSERNM